MLDSAQALVDEHAALERADGRPRGRLATPSAAASWASGTPRSARPWPPTTPGSAPATTSAPPASSPREDPAFAQEIPALEATLAAAEDRLRRLLIPRDPDDDRDVILEVKAGEGGEESALFAGDLLRMYLRHAERRGWRTEVLDATESPTSAATRTCASR